MQVRFLLAGPLMKPETAKAFRLFSIFTFKDLRSRAMRSEKMCHVPGAPMGTFGGTARKYRGHIVYPLVSRCDAMRSLWCLAKSVNSHGSSVRARRPREPKALKPPGQRMRCTLSLLLTTLTQLPCQMGIGQQLRRLLPLLLQTTRSWRSSDEAQIAPVSLGGPSAAAGDSPK